MPILEVAGLTKRFGAGNDVFVAVDNVSFNMKEGEILGFLGPNGAGKTTTIQMLLGVMSPTSGTISYFGKEFGANWEEIKEQINFSTTYINLPWRLSVYENLMFVSYLYEIPDRRARVKKSSKISKKTSKIKNKKVFFRKNPKI